MSDNPSHQPNWDCRQLLRKLYSLTARFEQACFPISSDNLYVYSSTPASLPFLSRGLLILSKCGHNVFVPHFLHCLDCFSPTGIQTWKNQESNPSLKSGSVKLKAPDVNAVFAGQMHPTEALLESSKPIFKRLRRWSQLFALIYVEGWLNFSSQRCHPQSTEIAITAADDGDIHQQCAVRENQSISQPRAAWKLCTFDSHATVCALCVLTRCACEFSLCKRKNILPISVSIHEFVFILKPLLQKQTIGKGLWVC